MSWVSIRLMTNILKIESIEWIRVTYLDWAAEPFTTSEMSKLSQFLETAGLDSSRYKPYNFLLEKDLNQADENLAWKGTLLSNIEKKKR